MKDIEDLLNFTNAIKRVEEFFDSNTSINNRFINDILSINNLCKRVNKITHSNIDHLYLNSNCLDKLYITEKPIHLNKNQKKILLFTHELSVTGAPMVMLDTAKILVKNGFFVIVISEIEGPLLKKFTENNILVIVNEKLHEIKYNKVLKSDESLIIKRYVNNTDMSIFSTATLYNYVNEFYNTNSKIMWWIHEGIELYKILGSRMPKKVSKNIHVYCGGQYALDKMLENKFFYNPKVLNYGIEEVDKNNLNKKIDEKINFVVVGSICYRKGQEFLLDAISNLPYSLLKQAEFSFVGAPYDIDPIGQEILKRIVKVSNCVPNIKYVKEIDRKDLYKEYLKNDVLLIPSTDDPMPMVATDCFMIGNICACSKNTGTSYYIKNKVNGFIFDLDKKDDLCNTIKYIINNKNKIDDMRVKSRKIYTEMFSMDIFEKNLLLIIKNILRGTK